MIDVILAVCIILMGFAICVVITVKIIKLIAKKTIQFAHFLRGCL